VLSLKRDIGISRENGITDATAAMREVTGMLVNLKFLFSASY
jgi:hypothetical protein